MSMWQVVGGSEKGGVIVRTVTQLQQGHGFLGIQNKVRKLIKYHCIFIFVALCIVKWSFIILSLLFIIRAEKNWLHEAGQISGFGLFSGWSVGFNGGTLEHRSGTARAHAFSKTIW